MTTSQGLLIEDINDISEEAHKRTIKECEAKNITLEYIKDNEILYTEKAQKIFDKHYKELEALLNNE